MKGVRPVIALKGIPYDQMRSLESQSTSERKREMKEGMKGRKRGHGEAIKKSKKLHEVNFINFDVTFTCSPYA